MMCTAVLSTVTHAAHEQEKLSLSSFWVVGWWQKYICVFGDTINLPCLFLLLQVCESGSLVIFWNMGVWPQRHSQEMRFPLPTTSAVLWRCLIIQGWMASKHIGSSSPIFPPESVLSGPIHQLWKLQTCPRKPLLLKVMSQFRKQTLYVVIRFCILVDCMFHRVSMQKKQKNANSIHSMVSNKEEGEKDLQIAQILDQPDHKGCWNLAPRNKSTIKERQHVEWWVGNSLWRQ